MTRPLIYPNIYWAYWFTSKLFYLEVFLWLVSPILSENTISVISCNNILAVWCKCWTQKCSVLGRKIYITDYLPFLVFLLVAAFGQTRISFLLINWYLLPRACVTKIGLVSVVSPLYVFINVILLFFQARVASTYLIVCENKDRFRNCLICYTI